VYVRKIENKILTFIVSGMLWRNSLIMQDTRTGSYWSHITGEALLGDLKGKKLAVIPVVQTSWAEWRDDHPDTYLLKKSKAVSSSAYENYFRDPDRAGLFRTNWLTERMPAKEIVHGISIGPHALAVAEDRLKTGKVVQSAIGEEEILIISNQDGGVKAYHTRIENQILSFDITTDNFLIKDRKSASLWDLRTGTCIEGQFSGRKLTEIQVLISFWFAWSSFYPNTQVLD
jgi:hypothetical protein